MKLKPGMREKNGSIEYRFTIDGKRYSVSGKTVKDCLAKEKEIQLRGRAYTSDQTLRMYFDEWVKKNKAPSTVVRYTVAFKKVPEDLKNKKISLITRADLSRIDDPHTIEILKSMFKQMVDEELIEKTPARTIKKKRTPKNHRALTEDEQKRFLEEAQKEWWYECFHLMLLTGLRLGEILALKWDDVSDVIKVRRSLTIDLNGRNIVGENTKTRAGIRDIPVTPQIQAVLDSQKRKSQEGIIFISTRGKYANIHTAEHSFKKIVDRAGIPDATPHSLRDTFATRWIERGGSMQILKNILGHASLAMTMDLYAQVLTDAKKTEMERIEIIPTKSPQDAPEPPKQNDPETIRNEAV